MTSRRTLALGAVAGPALMTAAWLGLGFVSPGYSLWGTRVAPYSVVSQPISGLGLGPTGPFMNAAFIVSGLLIIAGVAAAFTSIGELSPRLRWTAAVALALPGVGSIVDGVFTLEHFFMHFLGFALALSSVLGFPIAGWCLRRVPEWRSFGTALIAAGPVTLGLAIHYFATFTPTVQGVQTGIAGLTERLLILELEAWYVALGWRAFRRPPQVAAVAFS
jgi:hypothetical membrane protein